MAGDADGLAGLNAGAAPAWNRFAHWQRFPARLLVFALLAILVASALVPINAGTSTVSTVGFIELANPAKSVKVKERDEDLALYDRAIERIQKGENYYDFIVDEQRKANYPVRPGLAVRLPTLAYLDAWLGVPGQYAASIVLMLGVLYAWWRRLSDEPGGMRYRRMGMALMCVGVSLGLNSYFFVLHELWAGMLLALSFGLHRPGKWGGALAAAALALAIREHSLPFVLLMGAMAFWRRDWKEGAAWSALTLAFLALLAVHLGIVSAQISPSDPHSYSWFAMRGLSGWLSNVVLSSNVRFLPHWLAGPAVILMVFGWSGWRCAAGAFGTLLFLGYGLAFMIAGRGDNFYWGAMIAPCMFIGLAFVPMATKSLLRSAFAR
jgi:hypothetical protein